MTCMIIGDSMHKALKVDSKPSAANLMACAKEFDAMMKKVCNVVIPCKCECKHGHGQSGGGKGRKGHR